MRPGDHCEPSVSTSDGTPPRSDWPSSKLECTPETGTGEMQPGGRSDIGRNQSSRTLTTPGHLYQRRPDRHIRDARKGPTFSHSEAPPVGPVDLRSSGCHVQPAHGSTGSLASISIRPTEAQHPERLISDKGRPC
jgi:hypothetical protein